MMVCKRENSTPIGTELNNWRFERREWYLQVGKRRGQKITGFFCTSCYFFPLQLLPYHLQYTRIHYPYTLLLKPGSLQHFLHFWEHKKGYTELGVLSRMMFHTGIPCLAKNDLTISLIWAGELSGWRIHGLFSHNPGRFLRTRSRRVVKTSR